MTESGLDAVMAQTGVFVVLNEALELCAGRVSVSLSSHKIFFIVLGSRLAYCYCKM